jgi:Ser/Thr protein kinase RdoA (MazF antagonist)
LSGEIIDREQILRCLLQALPDMGSADFDIIEVRRGTINDVYRVIVGGHDLALRMRARASIFAYEKHLAKEALAGQFLSTCSPSSGLATNELAFEKAVELVSTRQCGGPVQSPISPLVIHYDQSLKTVPLVWTLQPWLVGASPQSGNLAAYAAIGSQLANLHKVRFSRFRQRLDGPWRDAGEWLSALTAEIFDRAGSLGLNTVSLADFGGVIAPDSFCLTHNDLQPQNIIFAQDGTVSLIDWDNLQLAPPEFDLVKLKHWTVMREGMLAASRPEYQAFLEAYLAASTHRIDPTLLDFCELVWLLRVAAFEKRRKLEGEETPKPFPPVEYYLIEIDRLKERLGH